MTGDDSVPALLLAKARPEPEGPEHLPPLTPLLHRTSTSERFEARGLLGFTDLSQASRRQALQHLPPQRYRRRAKRHSENYHRTNNRSTGHRSTIYRRTNNRSNHHRSWYFDKSSETSGTGLPDQREVVGQNQRLLHAPAQPLCEHGRRQLCSGRALGPEPRGQPGLQTAQHRGHPGVQQGGQPPGLSAGRGGAKGLQGGRDGRPQALLPQNVCQGAAAGPAAGGRRPGGLRRDLLQPLGGGPEPRAVRRKRGEGLRRGATQEEAPAEPHHLHHLPAARAGARLREVPLPGRVQPRGAGLQGQPARSARAGLVPEQKSKMEKTREAGSHLYEAAGLPYSVL
ncbi:hypothetical protein NDU88_005936 [Pleurodeles waltl]|uniref:Uncharacterized protein n=1 Tax=Pleurodeles waltl TaxID=8319 RepID=A0AAV7W970_PLEWA|nr:hypothetical protein NDU88_005936 [Pleurodeles waltl]